MPYKIKIEPEAQEDIQEAIDWYNEQQKGLGRKFLLELKEFFQHLRISPFFQIRYDEVRCLPLKKFPFMVHFTINEENETVIVRAVFNTSRDPKIWSKRK